MTGGSDLSSAIQAGAAVASVLGSLIGFVWVRFEVANRKTRRELKKCEDRSVIAQHHRATMTTVIELLWQIAPIGAAKQRARRLLDTLQTNDIEFPEDEAA